uniref:Uncharacterized protein n=1 Tax=Panagrolaimus sp. JU765 TaxID=591449 RepID=A0AC34R1W3_9BILA
MARGRPKKDAAKSDTTKAGKVTKEKETKKVEKAEKPAKAEAPKASPKGKRGRGRPPKPGNAKNDTAKKSPKKDDNEEQDYLVFVIVSITQQFSVIISMFFCFMFLIVGNLTVF